MGEYNQPDYKWYVVWMKPEPRDSRILSAWEYESDAKDDLKETLAIPRVKKSGELFEVVAKRTCKQKGLDPDDDLNWLNLHDIFKGERNPGKAVHARHATSFEQKMLEAEERFNSDTNPGHQAMSLCEFYQMLGAFQESVFGTGAFTTVDQARMIKWETKGAVLRTAFIRRCR